MNSVQIVSATDTLKTIFIKSVYLGPISTVYVIGQSPALDTIFREEKNLPFINAGKVKTDSAAYIRFINLSPNSTPLNISIKLATTNDINRLGYKSITEFKKYPVKVSAGNYVFEVRDATNTLRTTITLAPNNIRHKALSIVLKGLMGTTSGTNAFGFFQINYFN